VIQARGVDVQRPPLGVERANCGHKFGRGAMPSPLASLTHQGGRLRRPQSFGLPRATRRVRRGGYNLVAPDDPPIRQSWRGFRRRACVKWCRSAAEQGSCEVGELGKLSGSGRWGRSGKRRNAWESREIREAAQWPGSCEVS
jgi:hypothetical protein